MTITKQTKYAELNAQLDMINAKSAELNKQLTELSMKKDELSAEIQKMKERVLADYILHMKQLNEDTRVLNEMGIVPPSVIMDDPNSEMKISGIEETEVSDTTPATDCMDNIPDDEEGLEAVDELSPQPKTTGKLLTPFFYVWGQRKDTCPNADTGTSFNNTNAASGLSLIVTRAGGKTKELKSQILPNLPAYNRYFEPFVGGGSVFMGLRANEYHINDFSTDLVSLYRHISLSNEQFFHYIDVIDKSLVKTDDFFNKKKDELFDMYNKFYNGEETEIGHVIDKWCKKNQTEISEIVRELVSVESNVFIPEFRSSLIKKYKALKKDGVVDVSKIEKGIMYTVKAAQFRYFRSIYNTLKIAKTDDTLLAVLFFYILQFQYKGRESYNKKDELTSSYGGQIKKRLHAKLKYFRSAGVKEHFSNAHIYNMDFEEFLKTANPTENDFIFLDPPYDETFSKYDNNDFGKEDHIRLANYLLTECKAKWMMIIKDTDFIYNLYNKSGIYIDAYKYKYKMSSEEVTHLMITNYPLEEARAIPEVEYSEAA